MDWVKQRVKTEGGGKAMNRQWQKLPDGLEQGPPAVQDGEEEARTQRDGNQSQGPCKKRKEWK